MRRESGVRVEGSEKETRSMPPSSRARFSLSLFLSLPPVLFLLSAQSHPVAIWLSGRLAVSM